MVVSKYIGKWQVHITGITGENIDDKLKICIDEIKKQIKFNELENVVITTEVRIMTTKETEIHVGVEKLK